MAPGPSSAPAAEAGDAGSEAATDGGVAADGGGDDDSPWSAGVERCGNGIDDDRDGLIDEDCAPSLFLGWFPPNGSADLDAAGASHVARVEADLGRKLSVVQTYRSTTVIGATRAKAELERIWQHGAVAHLYFEPAADDVSDLAASAKAVVDALAGSAKGRVLLSFGAEMNGNWTAWGCSSRTAASFIALSRQMHAAAEAALAKVPAVDRRRLRWVYAPNSISSGGCGTPADYYPGHDAVDLLGMSAYRSASDSVATAVVTPTKKLMADLEYPPEWQRGRFIVLQTGSRTAAGDRGTWLAGLVDTLAADPAYLGVIPFDLSHATDPDRDWALLTTANPPVARAGYDAFIAAQKKVAPADPALEGIFDPWFWDVARDEPAYAEIQALRSAKITSGCRAAPPLFCPGAPLTHADAVTFLAGAFGVTREDAAVRLDDRLDRAGFAGVVASLVRAARPNAKGTLARLAAEGAVDPSRIATRAEAARWVVHGARLAPAPAP